MPTYDMDSVVQGLVGCAVPGPGRGGGAGVGGSRLRM